LDFNCGQLGNLRHNAGLKESVRLVRRLLIFLCFAASAWAEDSNPFRVEIDLGQQTAYLLRGRYIALESPISSGRYGHLTQTGSFNVLEKERRHYSSIYGKIVDADGNTVVADADVDMQVPRGCKFVPAPMPWFMRFHGTDGMHAGYLPGYPASHGCVRMPEDLAIAFFNAVDVGTPVNVFGRTPRAGEYLRYGPQTQRGFPSWFGRPMQPIYQGRFPPPAMNPRFGPQVDPRYLQPWWQ
jgi:L,D-transpeptidase catalytic domain